MHAGVAWGQKANHRPLPNGAIIAVFASAVFQHFRSTLFLSRQYPLVPVPNATMIGRRRCLFMTVSQHRVRIPPPNCQLHSAMLLKHYLKALSLSPDNVCSNLFFSLRQCEKRLDPTFAKLPAVNARCISGTSPESRAAAMDFVDLKTSKIFWPVRRNLTDAVRWDL